MILDGALIRRRRQDLSMSQRQLAQQLGVSGIVVSAVEDGTNHDTLPLGLVEKLAAALAVNVGDLLAAPAEPAAEPADVLVVAAGSLLLETQALTAVEAVTEALGISLPETKSVLDRLEGLLPRVGLVLHRHNGDVAIRPQATTDPDIRRRLLRLHQARRGLTLTEARVLYRVAQGEVDEGKLSNPDGVALNRLRRAGLVTDDVRPGLTTDTASGLKR